MSPPSTPSRSITPSSNSIPLPFNDGPSTELTPTSRVKAALLRAGLQSDSDDDELRYAKIKTTPRKELRGLRDAVPDYDVELVNSDAENTDGVTFPASPVPHETISGRSAYERVKQQLLAKPVSPQTKPMPTIESSVGSDDDDEPIPTKAIRKRPSQPMRRISKSPTPTSNHCRIASPTLFVSPTAPSSTRLLDDSHEGSAGSDSDALPANAINPRLRELVAEKQAKRRAEEEARKRAEKGLKVEMKKRAQLQNKAFKEMFSSEIDDGMDEKALRSLTQQSKPTRKASRKALEEMNRETQRMARNQQLAHEAKTKKKITTKDLFKIFNFRQENDQTAATSPRTDDENARSGALASSDAEGHTGKDTPPTSPPQLDDFQDKFNLPLGENEEDYIIRTGVEHDTNDEDLPTLQEIFSQPRKAGKGKAKVTQADIQPVDTPKEPQKRPTLPKKFRVLPPPKADSDSDDDLEIVEKKPSKFAVFDQLPANKANGKQSFHALRALAHLNSSEKLAPKGRKSLTMDELQTQLQQRARQQALIEKKERLDDLRARGIVIQTEEEREQDQLVLESLLEKARNEAQDIAKKEKNAAKKEEDGDVTRDILSDDEEDDGDWVEEVDDVEADADVELSGSEEEDAEAEEETEGQEGGGLIDNEAGENEDEEEEEDEKDEGGSQQDGTMELDDQGTGVEAEVPNGPLRVRSKPRGRKVIVDDDDEETELSTAPIEPTQNSQDDTMAAFGFQLPKMNGLGLTQMFKSTVADPESQTDDGQEQDSLAFLRALPSPNLPDFDISATQDTQNLLVKDSQTSPAQNEETQFSFGLSQFPSQLQVGSAASPTKFSEVPEPTQDAGFESFRVSALVNDGPHSTVETVMAPIPESPIVPKKGKLRRRNNYIAVLSDEEAASSDEANASEDEEFDLTANAFDLLFNASKKAPAVQTFDKKRSEAKKMVEEQADESEDEYAGLGGASDDEEDGETDEEMKKMIDEGYVHIDEGKIAQLYAENERADDEKGINKMYKDVTTGNWRRKRGADLEDLSDSDDEAEERRRRKQREFAKMRKALLEDENIGKIAENPKKLAFLRAIEDRDEEDDIDMLDEAEEQAESVPDSQDAPGNPAEAFNGETVAAPISPLKRKAPQDFDETGGKENVPPMGNRRRNAESNPRRLLTKDDISESILALLGEPQVPDSQISGSEAGSVHEDEYEDDDFIEHDVRSRREVTSTKVLGNTRSSVVNRLSMTRTNEEITTTGPLAFHANTANSLSGFKVPSLLRRATTNLSTSSTSSGPTTSTDNGIRRGGSKKSNIHYQAREAERKKVVEASERRRKDQVKKTVIGKGRQSVLGVLGSKGTGFE